VARTILFFHIISDRPSKQPLMVRTFLNICGAWLLSFVSARTNKRHHHQKEDAKTRRDNAVGCAHAQQHASGRQGPEGPVLCPVLLPKTTCRL
jgi:hypothetical protein